MSAMGQMRTNAVQQTATSFMSFKHLVSERVQLARIARDGAIPAFWTRSRCRSKSHSFLIAQTPVLPVFTRFFSRRNLRRYAKIHIPRLASSSRSMSATVGSALSCKIGNGVAHADTRYAVARGTNRARYSFPGLKIGGL
jgi:hypothetical protein